MIQLQSSRSVVSSIKHDVTTQIPSLDFVDGIVEKMVLSMDDTMDNAFDGATDDRMGSPSHPYLLCYACNRIILVFNYLCLLSAPSPPSPLPYPLALLDPTNTNKKDYK